MFEPNRTEPNRFDWPLLLPLTRSVWQPHAQVWLGARGKTKQKRQETPMCPNPCVRCRGSSGDPPRKDTRPPVIIGPPPKHLLAKPHSHPAHLLPRPIPPIDKHRCSSCCPWRARLVRLTAPSARLRAFPTTTTVVAAMGPRPRRRRRAPPPGPQTLPLLMVAVVMVMLAAAPWGVLAFHSLPPRPARRAAVGAAARRGPLFLAAAKAR